MANSAGVKRRNRPLLNTSAPGFSRAGRYGVRAVDIPDRIFRRYRVVVTFSMNAARTVFIRTGPSVADILWELVAGLDG